VKKALRERLLFDSHFVKELWMLYRYAQAPAVGRYLSELITGRTPTLDLSIFHPQRILENKPLNEGGIV
jgi:hypothetical protein